MRTAGGELAAGGFQVGTDEPLELLQFGNLADQHVLGDEIERSRPRLLRQIRDRAGG